MNQQNQQIIKQNLTVNSSHSGQRIDAFLATEFEDHSRGTIQKWISEGMILVDGVPCKAKYKLKGYESIDVDVIIEPVVEDQPEEMDLNIVFEDDDVLVIDKPAGMLVHPGAGNPTGTLLNGLLALNDTQATLPRAGIVHRLDKLTSGLMVVAKSALAYNSLVDQLKDHSVSRKYFALVKGSLDGEFTIDKPIGRHKTQRIKMAVVLNGKHAVTHIRCLEKFKHYSAIEAQLETGRTHQIRVHLHHIGHQLLGDPVYGNPQRVEPGLDEELKSLIRDFPRQALHAQQLEFRHPKTQKLCSFHSDLPQDLYEMLEDLRDYDSGNTPDSHDNGWEVVYQDDDF